MSVLSGKLPPSTTLSPDPHNTCKCSPETRSWMGVAGVHFCAHPTEEEKDNIRVGWNWVGKVMCEVCGLWAPQAKKGDDIGCYGMETAGWALKQIHKQKTRRDLTGMDGEGI